MHLLRALSRSGRALAGLLLLATLVVGEAADTRHHLSGHGCATDAHAPGRDDNCTCAGLHVAPLAGTAPVALAPVALAGQTPARTVAARTSRRVPVAAAPRAPPRS